MKILVLKPDTESHGIHVILQEIDGSDTLHEFYRVLDCRSIDMLDVRVGKRAYVIICDDEFLYKDPCIPVFRHPDGTILCGRIAFARLDKERNTVGLKDSDIPILREAIKAQIPSLVRALMQLRDDFFSKWICSDVLSEDRAEGAVREALKIINEY